MSVDARAQRRFGAVLYCLQYLLSDRKFKKIINELSREICLLNSRLHSVDIKTILKDMGLSKRMILGFGIITAYQDFGERKTED